MDEGMQQDERALIQRFAAGETAVFEELYRRHVRQVYAVCYRMLGQQAAAEDATQEVFLAMYTALPKFRGDSSVLTWAYRIAVRHCLRLARAGWRTMDETHLPDLPAPDAHQQVLTNSVVMSALGTLPPVYRAVLVLRYFEELSLQEIACAMASSVPVVKMRLHRAKKRLAQAMSGVAPAAMLYEFLEHEATRLPLPEPTMPLAADFLKEAAFRVAPHVSQPVSPTSVIVTAGVVAVLMAVITYVPGRLEGKFRLPFSNVALATRADADTGTKLSVTLERGNSVAPTSGIAPVLADPRLSRNISVDADGHRVREILQAISAHTKVTLTADPEVADQRLFLRVRKLSAAGVLTLIGQQTAMEWQATGSASPAFRLAYTPKVEAAIAAAKLAQQQTARREAIANLRAIRKMLATRTYDETALISCDASLRGELKKLIELPADADTWTTREYNAILLLLDDAAIDALAATDITDPWLKYDAPYSSLTPAQRKIYLHVAEKSATPNDIKPDASYKFICHHSDYGTISLHPICREGQNGSERHGDVGYIYSTQRRRNVQENDGTRDLTILAITLAKADTAYADTRLTQKLENPARAEAIPNRLTIPHMLRQIAEQTDIQVVSDYYTWAMEHQAPNYPVPARTTLGERLALLDGGFNIAWTLTPDNILICRNRNWPLLRESEPSVALIDALVKSYRAHGDLPLADLGKIDAQGTMGKDSIFHLLRQRLEDVSTIQQDCDRYRDAIMNTKGFFTLYSTLSPKQLKQAATDAGLVMADLSQEQQELVASAADGMTGDTEFTRDAALRLPLRLYVYGQETTYAALNRQIGRYGRHRYVSYGGCVSPAGENAMAFYLVFDIDAPGSHFWRYALPVVMQDDGVFLVESKGAGWVSVVGEW